MTIDEFAKTIGDKLEKVRKTNKITVTNMAAALNINRITYVRNSIGRATPNIYTVYNLGKRFGISLDWFLLDEEPMHRAEKKVEDVPLQPQTPPLLTDIQELLDHMDKIPLLRHEILAQFYRFKEDNQTMVEKAMKANS
ncbi:MAG: Helix-turn-helix protein [Acidobacteriota bacterium]|nr:Helix-turn-helix protein [Acidobacteriota bacterium]